ncbi:hypothetical protein ACFPT7_22200 [Acidicapsa dinghuensis]|uniref:HEPN domain-containing protein n=1 Tax=Acidicapsa dinghuensis TaxID=2218256 RepID=A0ABW1EMM5_9BACT|nr:hypothetical protein [Acidicapsa dinghuensis]
MPFDFTLRPPRPQKSDRLFRRDQVDDPGNARLRSAPNAYTLGYRRAADRLVQYAMANQAECNTLAYPIVFLYRHHIELALKRVIYCVPGVLRRELTSQEREHLGKHKLDLLWHDLEPIFESICEAVGWEKPNSADVEGTREYIRQLSEVDPISMTFRYWASKDGNPSLPANLDVFNIRHFSEMMGRLADYLEALDIATTAADQMLDDLNNAY